jgi:hypothetical protein
VTRTAEHYLVIRDVPVSDKHNYAGKDVPAGTVLYGFHEPTYGAVDTGEGIALSERPDEYPFFEFPRDAIREIPPAKGGEGE